MSKPLKKAISPNNSNSYGEKIAAMYGLDEPAPDEAAKHVEPSNGGGSPPDGTATDNAAADDDRRSPIERALAAIPPGASNLDVALAYVRHGVPVRLPSGSAVVRHSDDDAESTEAAIRKEWAASPDAPVRIVVGLLHLIAIAGDDADLNLPPTLTIGGARLYGYDGGRKEDRIDPWSRAGSIAFLPDVPHSPDVEAAPIAALPDETAETLARRQRDAKRQPHMRSTARPPEGDDRRAPRCDEPLPELEGLDVPAEGEVDVTALKAAIATEGREENIIVALGGDPTGDCPLCHDRRFELLDDRRWRCYCVGFKKPKDIIELARLKIEGPDKGDIGKTLRTLAVMIGRRDLIGPEKRMKQDASLLNAPAEKRDDALLRTYALARTGVPDLRVTIDGVCIKSLSNFPGNNKPALYSTPCLALRIIDPTGATIGVQQIWIREDGSDRMRSDKGDKKQKFNPGFKIGSGGVVCGGDPTKPHATLIVTEGVETGWAVAHAKREEIAAGSVAVVAALSKAGMAKLVRFPTTERLILAADNDPDGGGEKAARDRAKSERDLKTSIALAPTTDWLDVLNERGENAVRDGIDAAEPFVPDDNDEPDFDRTDKNQIKETASNIRIALDRLGVTVRHDEFARKTFVDGLDGFGPQLDDAAVNRLRIMCEERFRFRPGKDFFYDAVDDYAHRNRFHPVRDYFDGLEWDGIPRLETWMIRGLDANDTPFIRAVSRLVLVALVRRVRQPGAKFDEIVVLEGPEGKGKSDALLTLARRPEWFSDNLDLGSKAKEVIEQTEGKLIIEIAELKKSRAAEIEHIKAFASRREDAARLSYGRLRSDVPRQFILFGTTNETNYLKSLTGNRRFWPVRCGKLDLEWLCENVDQLWAEAAHEEAEGVSIRLPEELWASAAEEQEARLATNPYLETLADTDLDELEGKVPARDVWAALGLSDPKRRGQLDNELVGAAMRTLGFERSASRLRFGHRKESAYFKGDLTKTIRIAYVTDDGGEPRLVARQSEVKPV